MCKIIDLKNENILIETNFGKYKVVTKRPVQWDEIDFPQQWVIEVMHNRIDNHRMSSRISRSNYSYISHVDYIIQVPSRASTSQIRENYRYDNIKIDKDNIARPMPRPS
ncbi:hypothetical protein H5410_041509 [Solanum commersonii]|uniref:Uncharacterized protein n=1 Tax=Solanum commersonii TaxID=4109 RepID=A0A9J5XRS8_SOLCO|nr:hypothetical protein H5410_041509 [Solanum commersonii]